MLPPDKNDQNRIQVMIWFHQTIDFSDVYHYNLPVCLANMVVSSDSQIFAENIFLQAFRNGVQDSFMES